MKITDDLINNFIEVFDMVRVSLDNMEKDFYNEDEGIRQNAIYIAKEFIISLLELRDKLNDNRKHG